MEVQAGRALKALAEVTKQVAALEAEVRSIAMWLRETQRR